MSTTSFEVLIDSCSLIRMDCEMLPKIKKFFNIFTYKMNIVELNTKIKLTTFEQPQTCWQLILALQQAIKEVPRKPDPKDPINPLINDKKYTTLSLIDKRIATQAIKNNNLLVVTNDSFLRKSIQELGGHAIDIFSLYHFANNMARGKRYYTLAEMYAEYVPLK